MSASSEPPASLLAEWEAAGLYDPHGGDADEMRALLAWLSERGITTEEMVRARVEGTLTGLAADRRVRPGLRVSARQVADIAGLDPDEVAAIWIAAGLPLEDPDEPVMSEADAETFQVFRAGEELFGAESTLRFTRVMGSALARIAEAAVWLFLADVEGPLRAHGGTLVDLARKNLQGIEALGVLPTALDRLFRAHVDVATRRSREMRAEDDQDQAIVAVGFVDLVGFTPLAERVSAVELAAVLDEFEGVAYDTAARFGGRVVKLIGDEVMFVTTRAVDACAIAAALVDRFHDHPRVTPRGAVALGHALARGGDYYGPIVNLASRVAELAVPEEILVTVPVRDAAVDAGWEFEPAGRRLPKGIGTPVVLHALVRNTPTGIM